MKPNLKVLMIGIQPPNIGGIASYIRDLKKELKKNYDVEIISIKIFIGMPIKIKKIVFKFLSILINLFQIANLSINKKFDVAHIHTSSQFSFLENSIYSFFLKIILKKPIILHIHAPDFDQFVKKTRIFNKIYIKKILNIFDTIIVLSTYWKNFLTNEIEDQNKLVVIYNAASSDFSVIKPEEYSRIKLNLQKNKKIIFSFGNLLCRKGFQYLIESMSYITKNREDILCFIGGSGEFKPKLEKQITQLKLENYVKLIGFIPDGDLNLWMNAADVIVIPSLHEGSPIVMFEALNCGKPIVGTKVGGIPDIINSKEYGFLVQPANSMDLAEKILIALDKKWDKNIILDYATQFSWYKTAKQILNIYQNLIYKSKDSEIR
jgi:teichuronic acid biosynthesis glycosyltransferase TuaC